MKGYMTVRKPRGRRRHIVSVGADDNGNGAPCGEVGPWIVVPDAEPNCATCKARAVVG